MVENPGCKSHRKSAASEEREWEQRAKGDGEEEGRDGGESRGRGEEGVMGRVRSSGDADCWFHEAHFLGTHMGCYGTHLLLLHLHLLHGWLCLLS